jgi:hypothetical protein
MNKPPSHADDQTPTAEGVPTAALRDRMEFLRFKTPQDLRKALGIFREVTSSEIYFTFREDFPPNTCVTNTATVRALQARGIPFEWLTENV